MGTIAMDIPPTKKLSIITLNKNQNMGMNINTNGGTKDHSKLKNLDFDNSGHTGFQREGDYPNEALTNSDIERLLNNFS